MDFFGNYDKNPSPADVDKFNQGLIKLGNWREFHRYDGTDHGFMNKESAKSYREKAAIDSWARGLAFMPISAPFKKRCPDGASWRSYDSL